MVPAILMNTALKFCSLLGVILIVLFWKSFVPGYVHFSNDGPLGQQVAAYIQPPFCYIPMWGDLNDLGSGGGLAAPDIKGLFFAPQIAVALYFLWVALWFGAWRWRRAPRSRCLRAVFETVKGGPAASAFMAVCMIYAMSAILVAIPAMVHGLNPPVYTLWFLGYFLPLFTSCIAIAAYRVEIK